MVCLYDMVDADFFIEGYSDFRFDPLIEILEEILRPVIVPFLRAQYFGTVAENDGGSIALVDGFTIKHYSIHKLYEFTRFDDNGQIRDDNIVVGIG